jgi:hypothetical protein
MVPERQQRDGEEQAQDRPERSDHEVLPKVLDLQSSWIAPDE